MRSNIISAEKRNPFVAFSTSIPTEIGVGNVPNYFHENHANENAVAGSVPAEISQDFQDLDLSGAGDDGNPSLACARIGHGFAPFPADFSAAPQPAKRTRPSRRKKARDDGRRRRVSKQIERKQATMMERAFTFARLNGRPLNCMVTIRDPANDNCTMSERQANATAALERIACHYRDREKVLKRDLDDDAFEMPFCAVWVRESKAGTMGEGEHLHCLCNVIDEEEWRRLDVMLRKRFPTPNAVDLSPRDQEVWHSDDGQVAFTAVGYLTKSCTQLRAEKRQLWQGSGPVLGKRWGITRNIGPRAILKAECRFEGCLAEEMAA